MTGGNKDDAEKPPMDLLPPLALFEVAAVLGVGAKTYGRFNWRKGLNIGRCIAAGLRHVFRYIAGQDIDIGTKEKPGTFKHHLACAICEFAFALEFILEGREELDDRYKKEATGHKLEKNPALQKIVDIVNSDDPYKDRVAAASHFFSSEGVLPVYVCKCGKPNCPGSEGI